MSRLMLLSIAVLMLGPQFAIAQCIHDAGISIQPTDTSQSGSFGWASEISGDFAVVGDFFWTADHQGAAYAFRRVGSTWQEDAVLLASDGGPEEQFGADVAIDGNVILIGAPGSFQDICFSCPGAAYVYRHDGANWIEEQKLTPSDSIPGHGFGSRVAISGNTILVGAYADEEKGFEAGAVYVFEFNGTSWDQQQKLMASDAEAEDHFFQVAIDQDRAVVGAVGDDDAGPNYGALYVFERTGTTWVERQKLSDPATSLGWHVGICGDLIVDSRGGTNGAAYVFRQSGGVWAYETDLLPDGFAWIRGNSIDTDGSRVVIGTGLWGNSSGTVYVFRDTGSGWVEVMTLSDTTIFNSLGHSVDIDQDRVIAGAQGLDKAVIYELDDLALHTPAVGTTGQQIHLTTYGGKPGAPMMLTVSEIDGQANVIPVFVGVFDADGESDLASTIPPLPGITEITFQAFGFHVPGKIGRSNSSRTSFL